MHRDGFGRNGCSTRRSADIESVRAADIVTVRVGAIVGSVFCVDGQVSGRVWNGGRSISVR